MFSQRIDDVWRSSRVAGRATCLEHHAWVRLSQVGPDFAKVRIFC